MPYALFQAYPQGANGISFVKQTITIADMQEHRAPCPLVVAKGNLIYAVNKEYRRENYVHPLP
jgi:hypothetical protein